MCGKRTSGARGPSARPTCHHAQMSAGTLLQTWPSQRSARELKALLEDRGIDHSGAIEKSDLERLAAKVAPPSEAELTPNTPSTLEPPCTDGTDVVDPSPGDEGALERLHHMGRGNQCGFGGSPQAFWLDVWQDAPGRVRYALCGSSESVSRKAWPCSTPQTSPSCAHDAFDRRPAAPVAPHRGAKSSASCTSKARIARAATGRNARGAREVPRGVT